MSTMVDNRWDPILQNQQGPITSGYVSNSDIRQRERKDQIKWERQREYEDLMNKPGEPEQGQQQQKKDTENKRREELYRNSQQNYRPPPEPEMYDHGQIAKDLREERQKEYNDYLKQKISEEHSRIKHRHRYTPAGGLAIGQYDLQRKRLRDELSRDYKQSLLKQQKEQLYNRATQQGEVSVINRTSPTQAPPNQISPRGRPPPHPDSGRRRGPPPQQNDRMQEKSRETQNYWNEGRQAPSPKSVESDSKNVKPINVESETKNKQPMESHRPQEGDLRTGFFDDRRASPLNRDERQQDYQQFLANKQREDEMKHQRLEDQRHAPHLDLSKGDYYDAETYERKRMSLNSERKNDYQNFLSKTSRPSYRQYTPESLQGLPIGQTRYDHQKKQQEVQRNREYNEHLAKKGEKIGMEDELLTRRDMTLKKYMEDQVRSEMHDKFRDFTKPSEKDVGPDKFGLPIGQFRYDDWRKHQVVERSKEYQDMQAQKHGGHAPRRMPDQAPANSIGFMANLGRDGEREKLNKERQGEYRKFLDEKAFGKEGMPRGRPNWVDGKDSWFQQDPPPFHKSPVRDQEPPRDRPASYGRRQTPTYEEILDSKRREEASYRRFEDPEYSRGGGLGGPNDRYD